MLMGGRLFDHPFCLFSKNTSPLLRLRVHLVQRLRDDVDRFKVHVMAIRQTLLLSIRQVSAGILTTSLKTFVEKRLRYHPSSTHTFNIFCRLSCANSARNS